MFPIGGADIPGYDDLAYDTWVWFGRLPRPASSHTPRRLSVRPPRTTDRSLHVTRGMRGTGCPRRRLRAGAGLGWGARAGFAFERRTAPSPFRPALATSSRAGARAHVHARRRGYQQIAGQLAPRGGRKSVRRRRIALGQPPRHLRGTARHTSSRDQLRLVSDQLLSRCNQMDGAVGARGCPFVRRGGCVHQFGPGGGFSRLSAHRARSLVSCWAGCV